MPQVKTRTGIMNGFITDRDVNAFLGIPYAQQPMGDLRWKPARPLPDSDEEIECKEFGHTSIQEIDEYEAASLHPQGEDCLCLNIWVKDLEKQGQPVMVYIHGGANISGGSADPLYNGDNFAAARDVVIVTINYRVGVLGSMALWSLPGGEDYKESGYVNITDQVAALTWIHDNIESFGGDPENVTLFGESAGSSSVGLLSVCPAASGLFQKAICESGPIQLYTTPELDKWWAAEFAKEAGCTTAQELATLPLDKICAARDALSEKYSNYISIMSAPECDGNYLPKKPFQAWKDGAASDITMMMGSTDNEFSYFELYLSHDYMPIWWHDEIKVHFDETVDCEHYEKLYLETHPGADLLDNYLAFMNNTGFFIGAEIMAENQAPFNKAYHYRFTYKSRNEGLGSCHAIEVPFIFMNLDTSDGLSFTGPNPPEHLAREMNEAWYAFAKSGSPETETTGPWPTYDAKERKTMVMDENGWKVEEHFNEKNHETFAPMYAGLFDKE